MSQIGTNSQHPFSQENYSVDKSKTQVQDHPLRIPASGIQTLQGESYPKWPNSVR